MSKSLFIANDFPHREPRIMAMAAGAVPRALLRTSADREREIAARGMLAVNAMSGPAGGGAGETETAQAIRELNGAFERFKAHHNGRLDEMEDTINKHALLSASGLMGGGAAGEGGNEPIPVDREYTGAFASYARRGAIDAEASLKTANAGGERAAIQAAMSEGDNSAGGYLAPIEWDRRVRKAMRHLSPMRRLAQVVSTGVNGYSTLWSDDKWGSGWVGETANRPATSNPSLTPLVFPAGEIYAMPAATQRLLDDAMLDLEGWIASEIGEEFARNEGIAFVAGNGINKPLGFLQYLPGGEAAAAVYANDGVTIITPARAGAHPGGNLGITNSGVADGINADSLVDLKYGLATPYRQNATWVMNSNTAARIAKMKDGQGAYIWREALKADEPAQLLGRPVEIDENMPDIAAGAYPVAIGDFVQGYLINDRIGVRILRDPFTNKPYVLFYATKRVGGGVLDPKAIRVLKVSA